MLGADQKFYISQEWTMCFQDYLKILIQFFVLVRIYTLLINVSLYFSSGLVRCLRGHYNQV